MIYGLVCNAQQDLIDKYCFKECRKIICGGITDGLIAPMWPCREETCPHEEKRSPVMGEVNGEEFKLRKLRK